MQFNARAVFSPEVTHDLFKTGSVPGVAASKKDTAVLTGSPNSVDEPENSLDLKERRKVRKSQGNTR